MSVNAVLDRTGMATFDASAAAFVRFGSNKIEGLATLSSAQNFQRYWVDTSFAVPSGTFASFARTVASSSRHIPSIAWKSLQDITRAAVTLILSNVPFYSSLRKRAFVAGVTLLGHVAVRPGTHLDSALAIITDRSVSSRLILYDMELNIPSISSRKGRLLSSSSSFSSPDPVAYTFKKEQYVKKLTNVAHAKQNVRIQCSTMPIFVYVQI